VTTDRPRRAGLPLLIGAILLACATGFAIASLRAHADERREAQVLLGTLRAGLERHSALAWEAVANGRTSLPALDSVETEIQADFDHLARIDPGEPLLLGLIREFDRYQVGASDVLDGIGAGSAPSAVVRTMRNAAGALDRLITAADGSYRQSAEATSTAADIGTSTILVSSAVLLVLLFRRSERERRTATLLAHEKRVLRYSEERYRALVQRSSDMVTVVDTAGMVRYQSPSAVQLLGVPAAEAVGRPWRSMLHPDDAPRAIELIEASGEGSQVDEPVEWRVRRADGSWLHLETAVTNLLDEPAVQGIVLNSRDVGERHELQRRLTHQAFHDPLTGLPNRAQFVEALKAAMARAHRRGTGVAVLLLDLDGFKTINDSLGHAAGDELLVGVAERLRAALRAGDTAARLAGDEFVMIIEDGAPDDAARVAERIVKALRRPFTVHGRTVFTSASIGIVCRTEATEPESLLRDADVAMYRAKARGEHGYVLFEPDMHAAAVRRLQIETELREAVARSQLTLVYQPIRALATGRVIAFEALARWRHPRLGDVPPKTFIPIAEETGLIHALGGWVIESAANQLAEWRRLGSDTADLQMCINLSVRQLHDPELPGRLAQLLRRMDLPPDALVMEMTEGAFRPSGASAAAGLAAIRDLGVRIAIDDFGTGYSTLGRLRDLPVDTIKIDRTFVAELDSERGPALVRSMVDLARALDLITIAEGVETDAQRECLLALGCGAAQGYFLGHPQDAAATAAWLFADVGAMPSAGPSGRRPNRTPAPSRASAD
jgi:diguanylate cyclase (GGDEF)-like protein/PAS domain S-box-containing protein